MPVARPHLPAHPHAAHRARGWIDAGPRPRTITTRTPVAGDGPVAGLHYAPNNNFDSGGNYAPGTAGFNLADVSSVDDLASLPSGVKGLVWLGLCDGVDSSFISAVRPF